MEPMIDYYAVLGVAVDASPDVIKKAFKHLALHSHPDVYKGADAEQRMRDLLTAYQTLSDPAQRRSYNLSRAVHRPSRVLHADASTDESAMRDTVPARMCVFPPLPVGQPAALDLGEITYLLSAHEARRLKEDGMLRGAKLASLSGNYVCHRYHFRWQATSLPASVLTVRRAIGASTSCCASSTAMPSSRASKSATRWERLPMGTVGPIGSVHPMSCSHCVLHVANPSGVLLRKNVSGTCVIEPHAWLSGGGVSVRAERLLA